MIILETVIDANLIKETVQ